MLKMPSRKTALLFYRKCPQKACNEVRVIIGLNGYQRGQKRAGFLRFPGGRRSICVAFSAGAHILKLRFYEPVIPGSEPPNPDWRAVLFQKTYLSLSYRLVQKRYSIRRKKCGLYRREKPG